MRHQFCPQRSRQDALTRRVLAAERLCESVLREQECLRQQLEALVREVGEMKEEVRSKQYTHTLAPGRTSSSTDSG
jgi:hypothetical protein